MGNLLQATNLSGQQQKQMDRTLESPCQNRTSEAALVAAIGLLRLTLS